MKNDIYAEQVRKDQQRAPAFWQAIRPGEGGNPSSSISSLIQQRKSRGLVKAVGPFLMGSPHTIVTAIYNL